jgi:hypothetical protein
MSGWWNQRSLFTRLLVYGMAAALVLVMAAGIGAVAALVVGGNVSSPTVERTRPDESSPPGEQVETTQNEQTDADAVQQQYSSAKREQTTPQDEQTTYVDEIGEIQANSVEAFLDSHEKLRRYDTLTSGDIEEMHTNQAALQGFIEQASDLNAPQKYREQKVVLLSAIDKLHQAAQLAYALAADPVSATQADFDDYDRYVDEAAAGLRRSNQLLGKDFEGIEGVREVTP